MKDRHSSGGLPVEEMAETGMYCMYCNSALVYSSHVCMLPVIMVSDDLSDFVCPCCAPLTGPLSSSLQMCLKV